MFRSESRRLSRVCKPPLGRMQPGHSDSRESRTNGQADQRSLLAKKRFDQLGDAPRDLSSRLHQEPEANASEAVLAAGELTRAGTRSATARGRGDRPTATPK